MRRLDRRSVGFTPTRRLISRQLWRCFCVLPALVSLSALAAPLAPANTPLTTVRQVRLIGPARAAAGAPVLLQGTVMVVPHWHGSFFFRDSTGYGISIDRTNELPAVHAGDVVRVLGVTGPGKFAPVINASSVSILGSHSLPPGRVFSPAGLQNGKQDSQWLAVRGVIRSAAIVPVNDTEALNLVLDMGGNNLLPARVMGYDPANIDSYLGATVRITGICASIFNTRRQFVGPRMYVRDVSDVVVEKPAPANPFLLPFTPVSQLLQFDSANAPAASVHVQGTVTAVMGTTGFYLQSGGQGVFVESEQARPAVGSSVQVIGFPRTGTYSPKLVNATFRPSSSVPSPSPLLVAAPDMLRSGETLVYAPFDSLLVRVEGKLVQQLPGTGSTLLLLESHGTVFKASLPRSSDDARAFTLGSMLAVTGVCTAITNEAHEAQSTSILLRSAQDVLVLRSPPWWAGIHALWVIGLLLLVLALLLGWLTFVRRQAALHDLAVRDALTGVYNRRGFLLMAERQWNAAVRHHQQMFLFYIDVDRFKQINDTFGHKAGDLALQATTALLRDCFRKTDVIGRLGGDEFAVAALSTPDMPEAAVRARIDFLLQTINARPGQAFAISLSVGVLPCGRPLAELPIEELLARADTLMYDQKRKRHAFSGQHSARSGSAQAPACLTPA